MSEDLGKAAKMRVDDAAESPAGGGYVTDSASAAEAGEVVIDPYACTVCNCHHHSTAEHDLDLWHDLHDHADWDES